jgi:hypothetical protein
LAKGTQKSIMKGDLQSYPLFYEDLPKKRKAGLTRKALSGKIKGIKRKDQTMKKETKQVNVISYGAYLCLLGLAAYGATQALGGGLRDAVAGAFIAACLVIIATLGE